MKFVNIIKKLQKGGFHLGLLVVGVVFFGVGVMSIIKPGFSNSSTLVNVLFMVIGLASAVFAVINLKNVFTTSLEENNYFDKVDEAKADPAVIEKIRNSNQPLKNYYFRFCGKLNQSYIMETTDREPVYELNCDDINLIKDYVYTFKNCLTGKEFTSKISHTVTTSYDGEGFGFIDKSYFKIDGTNIWEYIGNMGYSIDPYLESVAFSFKVKHYGVEVADIKAAGTNIIPEYEGKDGLRDIPSNLGLYRISCREEDIDAVAIIAFAVSRAQII